MRRRPARSTLFTNTTLYRSGSGPIGRRRRPTRTRRREREHRRRGEAFPCAGDHATGPVHRTSTEESPGAGHFLDRKSTRLNSSHAHISFAVFLLIKKKIK